MKHVLITGGSRGLGLAIVEHLLATSDWQISTVQRTVSPALQELQSRAADRLRLFSFDLADSAAIEGTFRDLWFAQDQPLDALVNNAAIAYDDLLTNFDLAPWEAMQRVNVVAPMMLSKAVIRRCLLHRRPGRLVHISSICARKGFKGLAMYGATKGALESFSINLAREWGSREIRSNCVVPGFMETDMSSSLSEETRAKIFGRTALQQPTSVASVAATVGFLLSSGSDSLTGQSLVVDSGT